MKSRRLMSYSMVALAAVGGACSSNTGASTPGSGGSGQASGGASGDGSGGKASSGGQIGSGGETGTGGRSASGGVSGSGGATSSGGSPASSGGDMAAGGATTTGGRPGSGGASAGGGGPGHDGGVDGPSGSGGGGGRGGPGLGGNGMPGQGGSTGAGGGGPIPLKNPPVPSAGCGKATTVTNGKKTITSGGQQRSYIIDIPTNYDMNKPYRFFYTSHWISSTAEAVQQQNFYFLKPLATAANDPAIFLAPQALPGDPNGTWDTMKATDQVLFDDILAYVKANLCIDTTRVFATGFSYGGMMTYSLSATRQKDIRAAVGIAPANYRIYVGTKTHLPIAWMQTTGMDDCTCPWVEGQKSCGSGGTESTTNGAKFIAAEHGMDNGCTGPNPVPTWQSGSHLCVDLTGCKDGYPTKVCTFNGPHTNINMDPGSSTNWIPQESWKFFTQF